MKMLELVLVRSAAFCSYQESMLLLKMSLILYYTFFMLYSIADHGYIIEGRSFWLTTLAALYNVQFNINFIDNIVRCFKLLK